MVAGDINGSVGASGHLSNGSVIGAPFTFDPRSLEIKTRSIEQTLVPLVSQVRCFRYVNQSGIRKTGDESPGANFIGLRFALRFPQVPQ